jgi:protein-L-isoaspartate(D-aspartate) O-methyltransferase
MTEQNFEQMRRAMVACQLRTTGVNDPRVLAAMGSVPRERFVPADRAALAYADTIIPLCEGRALNSPMALGLLLVEAAPQAGERALVIGAGTGYPAAVLARLCGSVVAVEEDPELAATAKRLLAGQNVKLVEGPLNEGHAADAPYDLILVDGAIEELPEMLIAQLAPDGRIALGVIERGVQRLAVGRRGGDGFAIKPFSDAASTPLPGFARPLTFSF